MSSIVVITAIESGCGFLLTSVILYLVLSRGRKVYHYLFAAFLFICAIWDLGTFLLMIRNDYLNELVVIGYIIALMCGFIPALIFHFSNLYKGQPAKWAIVLVWALTGVLWLLTILGLVNKIEGVYTYHWGNIFKFVPSVLDPLVMTLWFVFNLWACWILFKGVKNAKNNLEKRHFIYIASGTLVITLAIVKVGVAIGINIPFLLPLGMFLVDIFNAIIGIAIIKDRLFDITLIIKKGTLYSILAGLLIFVYSFVEHTLVTFIGEKVGENSMVLHLIAVAIGIAVLMPVKNRLERGVERYFAHRKLEL
jgi:hypothetical protein